MPIGSRNHEVFDAVTTGALRPDPSMSKPDTSRVDVASWQEGIEAAAECLDQLYNECTHSDTEAFAYKNAATAIRALTPPERAASPSGESGWRDIASAPKDGTEVDLWRGGERLTNCYYERGQWTYKKGYPATYVVLTSPPTHWRPLPAPPAPHVPAQAESAETLKVPDRFETSFDGYGLDPAELIDKRTHSRVATFNPRYDYVKHGFMEILNRGAAAEARCRDLEAEAAASRAEVDLLTKERDTEIAARTEQEARYGDLRFENAVLARQVDALAGALEHARGVLVTLRIAAVDSPTVQRIDATLAEVK